MERHAVVVADTTGVIHVWSPGAEALFGHDAATAVGQTLDLIVPERFRTRHWAGFDRAMRTGKSYLDGLAAGLPVVCRDGEVRTFPARFLLLRDGCGEVIGAMAVYAPDGTSGVAPFT